MAVLASAVEVPAQAATEAVNKAPAVHGAKSVTGMTAVPVKRVKSVNQATRAFRATATAWPASASGSATIAAPDSGRKAGARTVVPSTPVWLQSLADNSTAGAEPGASGMKSLSKTDASGAVAVDVLDHGKASALGVAGVVFTLSAAAVGRLEVGLDYAPYAQAYGGNYASRLHLVELPACALTAPQLAACRRQTALPSSIDRAASSVSAPVTLSAATGAGAHTLTASPVSAGAETVLAATDSTGQEGSAAGSYASTGLDPSGSWTQSGASGSWDYTYPVTLPASSTSLTPSADLSYDSGSVDGQTSSTQAQSSWVGDGWSTADSSITQTFTPCDDAPEGVTLSGATSDECYDGQILTLSLNGSTTSLVYDNGTYKMQDDDGDTVTHVTSSGNGSGTYNTDYWIVTDRSGTKYEFGRNELPGWKSGDATTNSVDSEPVYSANSGDPCYSSSGFSSSVCTMAYQWHLDYVVSPNKAAMSYYYTQATNYYGEDNGASDVPYVRDSYLNHVDYGFQDGGAYGNVPDRVAYTAAARCVASTCGSLSTISAATAATEYPDVPFDLLCVSGTTCTSDSPSFFSTVRLTAITTEQYSTSSAQYEPVDTYTLDQTEPATGDGTSPTLWLAGVSREGNDTSAGGSSAGITLPTVTFSGIDLQNRVSTASFPGLYRYRINQVTTETGEVIGVTYGLPDACSATSITTITPSANTSSCYPVYWTPQDYSAPVEDWFEKYAVTQVLETDTTGGALNLETDYKYPGAPAWHYDDNEVVKAQYRTWGQFRGYASVATYTGAPANNPQTESVTTYYQGMDGDYLTPTTTRSVSLTDSQSGTHTDSDQLAGDALETTTYLGSGGPVDHSSIYSYWVSPAVATRTRTGLPALTSNATALAETWNRQALTDGGTTTWRDTETDTAYDATATDADFALPTYTYTHTVPVNTAYDRCTTTTYAAPNTTLNIVGLVASTETDSVACSGFTEGSPASAPAALNTLGAPASVPAAQVVSATETFYDDTTFSATFPQAAAPTEGLVTMVRKASAGTTGSFTWQTESRTTYDAYGHTADSYNADGDETVTATTYNSVGLATAQTVTNALQQTVSTTLDPTRALAMTVTDANGVVTTQQYDALGRLVNVWKDSRPTTAPANTVYTYTVSDTSVSGTTTATLNDELGYATSVTIDDALGRVRQTQTPTPQGGRLINDTFYDSRGWVWKKNTNYWDSSTTPVLALDQVPDNQVNDQDQYTLDGLGRTVVDTSLKDSAVKSATTTVYNGDTTTVIPPTGGTITATSTDPLGRTTSVAQYTTPPALTTPSNTFTGVWYVTGGTTDTTTYGYDGHGNQATTANAGATWTSTYNLLGQVTSKTDPDAGTSTMVYDADGNLLQTLDADGKYTSATYDALGRETATYAASTANQAAYTSLTSPGNETASWVYDNANNVSGVTYAIGQTTTATAYESGYPYVTQALGFNVFGESLGTSLTVPTGAQNTALAKTWTIKHGYSTNTGLLLTDTYPAGGGLAAETVVHGYATAMDLPNGLGSSYGYSQGTTYDAYGNVEQQTLGSGTNEAYVTNTYDPHTNALTDQLVTRSTSTPADVDNEAYTYNADGQITASTDTRLGSTATSETQCYTYDTQDRLNAAWTATDNCAATPTTSADSTVGDLLGTASAYWSTWTFTPTGQRQTETDYATGTTNVTTTTTTTSDYNGNGTGQAHTLTSTSATGGSTATTSYGYDADGNMTTRTTPATGTQTLTWNNQDKPVTVTSSTGSSAGYLYNTDGSLLVQTDGATTTLYTAGEQISYNTTSGSTTAIRSYALPGGGSAVRTASGANYDFQITNQQGTSSLYLGPTAQIPTWRQFTPYGAPRGTTTTWIDNRGFLNQPTDTTTGLTLDGARQYDPTTGSFISLDPLFEGTDTQQLNGYSYAGNNPVDGSDPTGLRLYDSDTGANGTAAEVEQQDQQYYTTLQSTCDLLCTVTDSGNDSTMAYYQASQALDDAAAQAELAAQQKAAQQQAAESVNEVSMSCARYGMGCSQNNRINLSEAGMPGWLKDTMLTLGAVGLTVADIAQLGADPATDAADVADVDALVDTLDDVGDNAAKDASDSAGDDASSCATNSFAPATLVVMASGKAQPISTIKAGEKVETANPKTGKRDGTQTVAATMVHYDHNLLDVHISDTHGHTSVLHTTSEHLFWDATAHTWIPADQLNPGDALETPTGTQAHVTYTQALPGAANRYNLTVEQLHTYYVLAGTTPILVHNSNCDSIALGKTETDDNPWALADHSDRTGAPGWTDWSTDKNWTEVVRDALDPSSDTTIHFNLEGIDNPTAYADTANLADPGDSEYTAWELAMIRNAPQSVQDRVLWYNGASSVPNPFS